MYFNFRYDNVNTIKASFSSGFSEKKQLFFMTLFSYLIVHFILLLVARLVNLNFQYQQNIIEKEQAKQKTLQHQLQALRSQINPHFLFNALNSLNALIRQKSDKASTFVDKLSLLLRSTLQRSDKDFITIQDELECVCLQSMWATARVARTGTHKNISTRIGCIFANLGALS